MLVTRTLRTFGQVLNKQVPTISVTGFNSRRGNADLVAKRAAQNPKILITGSLKFF